LKEELVAANKELVAHVKSLEASIAENNKKMEETDEVLNCNIDVWMKLKDKREKLSRADEARKKAEELAESNA
jgi:hypothetical protein